MSGKPKRRWYQVSLKTAFAALTLVCLLIGGRIEYLRRMVAFHLNETFRCAYAKHSTVQDAIPDAIALMEHTELALRYYEAASHPWEIVDTTPLAISDSDAKDFAKDMVDGQVSAWLMEGGAADDATPEQRAFYAHLAESYKRYIRDHKSP